MKGQKWVLALDVGATHVSAGLASNAGEIKFEQEIPTRAHNEEGPLRDRIFELVGKLMKRAARARIKPMGIAVGAPGIVDTERGVLVVAGNIPELFGLPLGPELKDEFDLPALIENDVNAQAMAEMAFGVARGVKDFVLFSIGTDLGGGIVIGGRIHRGAHFIAAEFGHMNIELNGQTCVCGGRGCVREWVSGAGLGEKAGAPAAEVFAAAGRGDAAAIELVDEFARRFGAAIADVMKVLDPEMVVLAGEPFRREPELIGRVVKWTREYYFPIPQLPDFRVSELTKETAMLGPAAAFFIAHKVPILHEHGRRKEC